MHYRHKVLTERIETKSKPATENRIRVKLHPCASYNHPYHATERTPLQAGKHTWEMAIEGKGHHLLGVLLVAVGDQQELQPRSNAKPRAERGGSSGGVSRRRQGRFNFPRSKPNFKSRILG